MSYSDPAGGSKNLEHARPFILTESREHSALEMSPEGPASDVISALGHHDVLAWYLFS